MAGFLLTIDCALFSFAGDTQNYSEEFMRGLEQMILSCTLSFFLFLLLHYRDTNQGSRCVSTVVQMYLTASVRTQTTGR